MRKTIMLMVAALTALALVAVPTAAVASVGAGTGLWPSDHQAAVTDCGSFSRDTNNFCYIDDGGGVELGVKFTTSSPVLATGVRVYRVDAGSVTGSLWKADGTLLATGAFAAYSGHGWQDMIFTQPVTITPGNTYIASYFAPNADYAFEWFFFKNSSFAVGPITAQQSVEGDRNGVYCYVGESCNLFPTNSFQDTNYWVTPLWNEPPTVDAGGPYDVNEGGSVLVSATGSDPEGGSLTYAWDLDNNGSFETSGQSATFSAASLDGPSSHTIKVQATDDVGQSAIASTTVTVNNVLPAVNAPTVSPEPSIQGSSVTASATFSDPGPDAPFTCTVNYGDGSGDLSGTVAASTCTGPSHTYSTVGTYTVTVSVTDKDGSTSSNSTTHAVIYNFTGFFQPVDNLPVLNSVKAGQAIPVKFSLSGNQGLNIFSAGYPVSQKITCDASEPVDSIEQTLTAGNSSLSYDPTADQYSYVWKTDKSWAGTCRALILVLRDGSTHQANFKLQK